MRLYCANNNTIYKSVTAAANDLNIDRTSIHKQLKGDRTNVGGYVFAKLDDISPEAVRDARRWLLYSTFKIVLDVDDEPIIHDRR